MRCLTCYADNETGIIPLSKTPLQNSLSAILGKIPNKDFRFYCFPTNMTETFLYDECSLSPKAHICQQKYDIYFNATKNMQICL